MERGDRPSSLLPSLTQPDAAPAPAARTHPGSFRARHRLGLKRWHSVIGLRADEQRRVLRMRAMNCGSRTGAHAVLPLADAGVREADVLDWWKRQPFDLGIPSYAGNCTLCMLKGRAKLIRLIREDPSRGVRRHPRHRHRRW